MIQMPRRSVTRFFIPLIDVLTLLFCIYLLLPIVKTPGEAEGAEGTVLEGNLTPLNPQERAELQRLRREVQALRRPGGLTEMERQEIQRLRQEKIETLERRLAIRVLEIDADTGQLYYYDPERVPINTEAEARALIERHKREAPGRELYYLFLFPRRLTGFPQGRQVEQYKRWFEGVAYGFDNPRAAR
jgi:hypothetical protein